MISSCLVYEDRCARGAVEIQYKNKFLHILFDFGAKIAAIYALFLG